MARRRGGFSAKGHRYSLSTEVVPRRKNTWTAEAPDVLFYRPLPVASGHRRSEESGAVEDEEGSQGNGQGARGVEPATGGTEP